MSANNWATCPNCLEKALNDKSLASATAREAYGVVSQLEYENMMQRARNMPAGPSSETLREDYEIGLEADGRFYVTYTGQCTRCSFKHHFSYEKSIWEKK